MYYEIRNLFDNVSLSLPLCVCVYVRVFVCVCVGGWNRERERERERERKKERERERERESTHMLIYVRLYAWKCLRVSFVHVKEILIIVLPVYLFNYVKHCNLITLPTITTWYTRRAHTVTDTPSLILMLSYITTPTTVYTNGFTYSVWCLPFKLWTVW